METFDWIDELTMLITAWAVYTQCQDEPLECLAMETCLQRNEAITITQNKKSVTLFPRTNR
jgi:hypothetical protein